MTEVILALSADVHAAVWAHLLPEKPSTEQAAFLLCQPSLSKGQSTFDVIDVELLGAADFEAQYDDYLELTDEARIRVIKRAHALGASLVELHSHVGPGYAAFSLADRQGLKETVPHMWWRLKGRPYFAVVATERNFDALVWLDNPHVPVQLTGIRVGDRLLVPTNMSLRNWTDEH